jgi:hypothetical protein
MRLLLARMGGIVATLLFSLQLSGQNPSNPIHRWRFPAGPCQQYACCGWFRRSEHLGDVRPDAARRRLQALTQRT